MPVIPALWRKRQENWHRFMASLVYIVSSGLHKVWNKRKLKSKERSCKQLTYSVFPFPLWLWEYSCFTVFLWEYRNQKALNRGISFKLQWQSVLGKSGQGLKQDIRDSSTQCYFQPTNSLHSQRSTAEMVVVVACWLAWRLVYAGLSDAAQASLLREWWCPQWSGPCDIN